MRILHLVHQYPPDHLGGTELCTQDLARLQASHGHIPAVFVPSAGGSSTSEPSLEDGVRVYRENVGPGYRQTVFLSTFWNRSAHTTFRRVIDMERPDLVHIQHLMGLPASLVSELNRRQIPYILTLHDFYFVCANAQMLTNYDQTICAGPDRFLNCARCLLVRGSMPDAPAMRQAIAPLMRRRNQQLAPVLEGAKAVIAPSAFIRDEYARLGAKIRNLFVIPNGIQLPVETPAKRQPVPGELQVVYLGGIAWQKGVHVLIAAADDLPAGVKITIYGDLNVHKDYSTALQQQSQNPAVTFAGRLERNQVWPALAAADVVVVPSIWYENSPLIVQETRAVGTPIIASNLGALPEQVIDGRGGLLFPAGDSLALRGLILELHSDPQRLVELKEGIRPARRIDEQASEIETVYRFVMGDAHSL